MATITRGSFPDLLDRTIKAVWSDASDAEMYPHISEKIFNTIESKSQYEKRSQMSGLQNFPIKPEGEAMQYDTPAQGYDREVKPDTFAMGVRMTREMYEDIADGDLKRLADFKDYVKALKMAAYNTSETDGANILNRAFNASYTYGDAKVLLATDHPIPKTGGTASNKLSVASDLTYSSLTTAIQLFEDIVNLAGQPVVIMPKYLVVPTDLHVTALEIINSKLKPDTANNNVNAIGMNWNLEVCVNPYLTDADAWFLAAPKAAHKLVKIERVKLQFENEGDFDTWDMKWGARMRYKFDAYDWRGIAGSEGA